MNAVDMYFTNAYNLNAQRLQPRTDYGLFYTYLSFLNNFGIETKEKKTKQADSVRKCPFYSVPCNSCTFSDRTEIWEDGNWNKWAPNTKIQNSTFSKIRNVTMYPSYICFDQSSKNQRSLTWVWQYLNPIYPFVLASLLCPQS